MGGEIAGVLFWPEVAIIILLITIAAFKKDPTPGKFFGITTRQLLLGYAFGFIGLGFSAIINPFYSGPAILLFILGFLITAFALTVIGLPLLAVLNRLGMASFVGCVLAGITCALLMSAWMYVFPHNDWCAANFIQCAHGVLNDVLWPSLFVAMGFAIGAWLPIFRSRSGQKSDAKISNN